MSQEEERNTDLSLDVPAQALVTSGLQCNLAAVRWQMPFFMFQLIFGV